MGLVLSTRCAVIRLIRCASFKPLEYSCTQSTSVHVTWYANFNFCNVDFFTVYLCAIVVFVVWQIAICFVLYTHRWCWLVIVCVFCRYGCG